MLEVCGPDVLQLRITVVILKKIKVLFIPQYISLISLNTLKHFPLYFKSYVLYFFPSIIKLDIEILKI